MSILSWLEEQRRWSFLSLYGDNPRGKEGELWIRCDRCGVVLYLKHLTENYQVCYGCNIHLQMTSQARIEQLIDKKTWRTLDNSVSPVDPLVFRDQKGYAARLHEAQKRTGLQDALQTGTGLINGIPVALGVMDFYFMGGSMGSVVGERLTRLAEYSTEAGLTLVIVCCSGGARMQEGIFSLMQMAKVSAALNVFQSDAKLLYLSVLTSPTTGGVTASFAMLGDLIISEPKALIGFAGRRIIEQALNEKLPEDFQMAEGLLRHGLIDLIVPRAYLKQAISELLTLYKEAPFKKRGVINYGVRTSLSNAKEELIRRNYHYLTTNLVKHKQVAPKSNSFCADGLIKTEFLLNSNTMYLGTNVSPVITDLKVRETNNFWFSKVTSQFLNLFPSKKIKSSSQQKVVFFSTTEKYFYPKSYNFIQLTPQAAKKLNVVSIKTVLPCFTQSNLLYSTNSGYHTSNDRPLAISAQIQKFYKNKEDQHKRLLKTDYQLFLALINKKTTLWDSESLELAHCKKEVLERAFLEARSNTISWVGFYT